MKNLWTVVVITLASCTATVMAQPVFTPSSAVLSGSTTTPAISPSPVFVPGDPALTGAAPQNNNALTTSNVTPAMLFGALTNLEATVQATLPVIAAFNESVTLGGVGPATGNNSLSSGFLGTSVAAITSGTQSTNEVRASVQAMILLQGELENAVAALNVLTGTTNAASATNTAPALGFGGAFTNAFGF